MQFSSVSRQTIQLDKGAIIWSRSSQDGNKQFQVAFCWYFEYWTPGEMYFQIDVDNFFSISTPLSN